MTNNDSNIYKIARQAAGFTQERAVELIACVSLRSLAAYESGERIPPDDIVVRMVEIYNAHFLPYQHLRKNVELARTILPELTPKSLTMSVLTLQKEVKELLDLWDEVVEITCDGLIDEDERERWEKIMTEAEDVRRAVLALKFSFEEGKR